jgi:hypothetical protein
MDKFGPNSTEVAAFLAAAGSLTAAQWRKALATRRAVAKVTRDTSAELPPEVRSLLGGTANGDAPLGAPMSSVAVALGAALRDRGEEEVFTAWLAASALARRRHLPALTFAAHYLPFAAAIPLAGAGEAPVEVRLFAKSLRWLDATQWQVLAQPWSLDREASAPLLQAPLREKARDSEEAVALAALAVVSKHLAGDAGWAAVKTVVHGARVLSCRSELTAEQLTVLWAPLEGAVALRSLDAPPPSDKPARKSKRASKGAAGEPAAPPVKNVKRGPVYGPNHAEVASFIKVIPELGAIQWLRVLDRRQLVDRVTREGSDEPAAVVRSIVAAIRGTRGMQTEQRCNLVSAVERASYALASKDRLDIGQQVEHYGALAAVVPFGEVDAAGLAGRVTGLSAEEWAKLAAAAPPADVVTVAPLVAAGDALADYLVERSDDEAVTTWHALTALLRRHRLSPIKFAVSYAPFASAVAVTKPRSIGPGVRRYLTAVGRLSAHQCQVLADPWLLADDVSNALSRVVADGSTKAAEEAAALAALVTVPMRLTGDAGWAAAKTAVFGARVIASRDKVTHDELEALWKPLERAIPIASLDVGLKKS